jgi:hypothetical protein
LEDADWINLAGNKQVAASCEHGDEHLGYIKFGEFLDYLRTGLLLNKDYAPGSVRISRLLLFK